MLTQWDYLSAATHTYTAAGKKTHIYTLALTNTQRRQHWTLRWATVWFFFKKLWIDWINCGSDIIAIITLALFLWDKVFVKLIILRLCCEHELQIAGGGRVKVPNKTKLPNTLADTLSHMPEPDCQTASTLMCSSLDCWFPTKWAVLIGSLESNKLAHLSGEKRGLLLSHNAQSTWKRPCFFFLFFVGFFCRTAAVYKQQATNKSLL